ncbi:protein artemis [Podospora aff. communis PSN243]|uniref:Protein artemis n=1 Tax=Podospora aff. communis PSN243 TaxID=3040156 RepID=A0AAV9H1R7_9PEZI|nr:protein artemis [Podospora aff. communis PSN243]
MSTFNGLVAEFPDIRGTYPAPVALVLDFFRHHADLRPPLACFLSHIHSDHLAGLESLRSPFVYCSPATKEMLLRLERFPCRINYAKGLLEARVQRYKHLKNLLKPLPLETPTVLELEPGNHLQVTLFNANHCPGAVMFLFEGRGKAVVYTGDIRSEPWFVNATARSPALIEYSHGLKTLDTVYLDTSFTEDFSFPPKSEGIRELLAKVSKYPKDTIFHFQAWTYGYEDVWVALSKALDTKIHVDEYKMSIYGSLVTKDSASKFGAQHHLAPEAAGLMGFMCGNTFHPGCLTLDENVRLHSCEKGNYCQTVLNSPVVRIQPVITRLPNGQELAEVGVGGGGDDLNRDAELDYLAPAEIETLFGLICDDEDLPDDLKEQIRIYLVHATAGGRKVPLDLERAKFRDSDEIKLSNAVQAIAKKTKLIRENTSSEATDREEALPTLITFPYSRHSSYHELCHLLDVLRPNDVWPCTVDVRYWIDRDITIEGLFGKHCSGSVFRHDQVMQDRIQAVRIGNANNESQVTTVSASSSLPRLPLDSQLSVAGSIHTTIESPNQLMENGEVDETDVRMQDEDSFVSGHGMDSTASSSIEGSYLACLDSQQSEMSDLAYEIRLNAFRTILGNVDGISLISTTDNHSKPELDLGG